MRDDRRGTTERISYTIQYILRRSETRHAVMLGRAEGKRTHHARARSHLFGRSSRERAQGEDPGRRRRLIIHRSRAPPESAMRPCTPGRWQVWYSFTHRWWLVPGRQGLLARAARASVREGKAVGRIIRTCKVD